MNNELNIQSEFTKDADCVLFLGDCLDILSVMPNNFAKLIVTSPPYNIGKRYEKQTTLESYLNLQRKVITECVRVLKPEGSLCWQVGNYVKNGEIYPLDLLLFDIFKDNNLKLRNRIIWHFEHGLHCTKRLSGRYETILWYTKTDNYTFNLDPIRVPQKYPGKKSFKGPNKGKYSCNPKGKNPGDVWDIPNVKHNHPEKTIHPCQFPIELIERLVLSMTNPGDVVFDPFMGVGTVPVCAVLHGRRGIGSEIKAEYVEEAIKRMNLALMGKLPIRPRSRPIYVPPANSSQTRRLTKSTQYNLWT